MSSRRLSASTVLQLSLAACGLIALLAIAAIGLRAAGRDLLGDFWCFYDGARAARLGEDIYAAGNRGYIYPPLLAWVLQPLTLLDRRTASIVWELFIVAMIPAAAGLAAYEFARRLQYQLTPLACAAAAGFGIILVSDKLRRQLILGNCDLLVILAAVLALRWLTRRPWLAGALIGLIINIKYLPIVFVPYLIARGRWRALGGVALGAVGFALLPALTFGWETEMRYLRTSLGGLLNLGRTGDGPTAGPNVHPLDWEHSVSIPSALARTGVPGAALVGTLAVGAAALALAWIIHRARGVPLFAGRWGPIEDSPQRAGVVGVEWAMLSAGVLAFSPQTTPSHMTHALTLAVLAGVLVVNARGRERLVALAASGAFLAAMVLPPASNRAMVDLWRAAAGLSLGVLVLLYGVQWAGLGEANRLRSQAGRA